MKAGDDGPFARAPHEVERAAVLIGGMMCSPLVREANEASGFVRLAIGVVHDGMVRPSDDGLVAHTRRRIAVTGRVF